MKEQRNMEAKKWRKAVYMDGFEFRSKQMLRGD